MNLIARYTTPALTFKPRAVAVSEIDKIFLVIKQNGCEVIRKDIEDAVSDEHGFTWFFEQEDTAKLCPKIPSIVYIDYLSGATRYTIYPRQFSIAESGIPEVI